MQLIENLGIPLNFFQFLLSSPYGSCRDPSLRTRFYSYKIFSSYSIPLFSGIPSLLLLQRVPQCNINIRTFSLAFRNHLSHLSSHHRYPPIHLFQCISFSISTYTGFSHHLVSITLYPNIVIFFFTGLILPTAE